ncbi:MAG: alanine racemase [Gammaproteobacteria bacterium]|nr:alanine racemase [Gammaproteobacteria bacterium]
MLKAEGPGHPIMLVDRERLHHNIDVIAASVGPERTYRVVVKSLPSVPLLREVMQRAQTDALMVFHQPFLNVIAREFPDADVLMGKPMPVAAARRFYSRLETGRFDPARQLQWLIDTPERLAQYRALARELGVHLRINAEIDVGLHRGGFAGPEALRPVLKTIAADPDHLSFAGFMGYEPHLTGIADRVEDPAAQSVLSIYRGFIDAAREAGHDPERLTRNGAGSHTLRLYERDDTMNDLAAGSGIVKPTDFDTALLADNVPALFIATPILKRYDQLKAPVAGARLRPDAACGTRIGGGSTSSTAATGRRVTSRPRASPIRSTTAPTRSRSAPRPRWISRWTTGCSCDRPRARR